MIFLKTNQEVLMNSHNKKALITRITGQDGAYLAEFLIKRLEVHGLKDVQVYLILRELIIYIKINTRII